MIYIVGIKCSFIRVEIRGTEHRDEDRSRLTYPP